MHGTNKTTMQLQQTPGTFTLCNIANMTVINVSLISVWKIKSLWKHELYYYIRGSVDLLLNYFHSFWTESKQWIQIEICIHWSKSGNRSRSAVLCSHHRERSVKLEGYSHIKTCLKSGREILAYTRSSLAALKARSTLIAILGMRLRNWMLALSFILIWH